MTARRVAILGAGSSGIATCKTFYQRGIPFDCFEAADRVGGNWVYESSSGLSACYRGLTINTSKRRMEYPDYPMPDDYPDFPRHDQIAAYFDDYVDHFGFRGAIRFETRVTRVTRARGAWIVETDRGGAERYDALVVANGHHCAPRMPHLEGRFDGEVLHSHTYRHAEGWAGKRVVVLGIGNSAMDIAVEASHVADAVFLSSRRGAWVLPKYLLGRPADTLPLPPWIPFSVRRWAVEKLLHAAVGSPTDHGLPMPDHRLGEAHPTISQTILERLDAGAIVWRPNIARLDGDAIVFEDGTRERADVLVCCTGYDLSFPFFEPSFLSAPNNDLPLFLRTLHPDHRTLFFVGLVQPLGAIMPIADAQSRWIADALTGRYARPDAAELCARMEAERRAMFARYVASPRHTIQVDFDDYLVELERERRRGAERAARLGTG